MVLRSRHVGPVCMLVLAVSWAGSPARAQATLRYQLKEGQTLHYTQSQKMKAETLLAGQDVTLTMSQDAEITWKVLSVDAEGKARMTQKFDRIRFSMDTPTGKVEYDSKEGKEPDDPLGQMMAPLFKALTDLEFSLTIDPRGRTTDLKVPEKFTDLLREVPGGSGLGDMFSEDGMKRMLQLGMLRLPDGPVGKGDTWDQKVELKMPFGKMKTHLVYTYQGPTTLDGKKVQKIGLKPKLALEPDPAAALTLKLKDQESSGTAYFDQEAGRLVETNMTQNMTLETSLAGQDLTQKMEQTVIMKLVDKK